MTYEMFLEGIKWTEAQWRRLGAGKTLPPQFHYENLRRRGAGYWLNLDQMTTTQLSQDIITGFLNTAEWCCHLPSPKKPTKHAVLLTGLEKAVRHLAPYYQALAGLALVTLDFSGAATLARQPLPVSYVITRIYEEYCAIKPVFGRVPASKLMHMALPDLFMMWDNAIINGYGVPSCRSHVANNVNASYLPFLILMQENAKHVKATSGAGLTMNWPDFVAFLRAQCGYGNLVTMTRLLDIANYAVGHTQQGAPQIKCRRCCERANQRLAGAEFRIEQYTGSGARLGRFKC